MRPTSVPAAYRQRPGNGSGPRVALARDTMTDPGERACHKSKPMHQHGTPETSPSGVALGPEATTMAPAPQSSRQRCSPVVFRGRGSPPSVAKPNVAKTGSTEGSGTPTAGSQVATQALHPSMWKDEGRGQVLQSEARLWQDCS